MAIIKEMELAIQVQILDKVDCVSFCTNSLTNGMNPFLLSLAMSK